MKVIIDSLYEACRLLALFDREIYGIIALSLFVTVLSTFFSAIPAILTGVIIGSREFKGKKVIVRIINTLMGIPPVVAGLLIYLLLSRKGPLGALGILFTPAAMIMAQIVIIYPIITGIIIGAVKLKYKIVLETCAGLGIKGLAALVILLRECRYPIISAVMAGYGRAVAEVGAVMLVGGNIQYSTRVMTTAIVLETGKGNFDKALALGIILLGISFLINWILHYIQEAT